MKKISIFLVCVILLAFGTSGLVSAQAFHMPMNMFSVGGGALIDWSFRNGITDGIDYIGYNTTNFGGFAFFDATYAVLDLYLARGSVTQTVPDNRSRTRVETGGNIMQFGFSLLGKYPIGMQQGFTIFPLLGIGYNRVLSGKNWRGEEIVSPGNYSQFGIIFGGGLDYNINPLLFLRAEALFNIRFSSKAMRDEATAYKILDNVNVDTTLGLGPRIKVGVGYRL